MNFFRRKQNKPDKTPPTPPLSDPIEALAAALSDLMTRRSVDRFVLIDDGNPRSTRFVQFIVVSHLGDLRGEINVMDVSEVWHSTLAGFGWQPDDTHPDDRNWWQEWTFDTSPQTIATTAVDSLYALYGKETKLWLHVFPL